MRDIFFRGKCLGGKWVYGGIRIIQNRYYIIPEESNPFGFEVDPSSVGQFTGAIGTGGVKIFEGDVLYPVNKRPYVVFWRDDNARFALKNSTGFCLDFYKDIADEYIVIGNMYDNPILLKSGLLGRSNKL